MSPLSHFDADGASRMVDVGSKEVTLRVARAVAYVRMAAETLTRIRDRRIEKGDVFEVARLAGIQAVKRTADLIPLCHPLGIDAVDLSVVPYDDATLRIDCTVRVHGRTGVEMEALTGASVAALTVYDMCKAIDRSMTLGPIGVAEKSGGKSGRFASELRPDGSRD